MNDYLDVLVGAPGTPRRDDFDRHMSISNRTDTFLKAVFGWTERIPLVGRVVYVFWYSLFQHDMQHYVTLNAKDVLHPWGALGFSFLNDGMKPSLWHTLLMMRHDNDDPYVGIYPGGAPRNRREADAVIARER